MSLFPDKFPHYAWTAALSTHSDFVGSKVYTCWGVTCHLHFWQNDWSLLCATVITRGGWNRHRIRVSTQSWLWRRKFSPHSCHDPNSQPSNHKPGTLTNKLSQYAFSNRWGMLKWAKYSQTITHYSHRLKLDVHRQNTHKSHSLTHCTSSLTNCH